MVCAVCPGLHGVTLAGRILKLRDLKLREDGRLGVTNARAAGNRAREARLVVPCRSRSVRPSVGHLLYRPVIMHDAQCASVQGSQELDEGSTPGRSLTLALCAYIRRSPPEVLPGHHA